MKRFSRNETYDIPPFPLSEGSDFFVSKLESIDANAMSQRSNQTMSQVENVWQIICHEQKHEVNSVVFDSYTDFFEWWTELETYKSIKIADDGSISSFLVHYFKQLSHNW